MQRLELVVRSTDRVYPIAPGQTLIAGRTPACDVQLDDPSVSRRHCSISCAENGRLQVRDLESANGTFVNERAGKEGTAGAGALMRQGAALIEIGDPEGAERRTGETMMVDESTIESVIQRRIEPASFEWLAQGGAGGGPGGAGAQRGQ